MEIDDSIEILDWEATRLSKSKFLIEDLATENPIIFQDDYVTLHHEVHHKDS